MIDIHETLFSMVLHFDINLNKKSNWCISITLSIKKNNISLYDICLTSATNPYYPLLPASCDIPFYPQCTTCFKLPLFHRLFPF